MNNNQQETKDQAPPESHEAEPLLRAEFFESVRAVVSRGKMPGAALFLFQEDVVLHTMRALLRPSEIPDLSAALDFLQADGSLHCLRIEAYHLPSEAGRSVIAFPIHLPDTQAVLFHAMWQQEQQWRISPPDTLSIPWQEIEHLRQVAHHQLTSIGLQVLTEQEALPLLLPPGPYTTYLGWVVVRWNNTSCHSICPFCSEDFKPSWGWWAFLYDLGGFPICFDCWRKGPLIVPTDEKTVPADPGHTHVFEPDDTQGHSGDCTGCGGHWTHHDGWWRQNSQGVWCREVGGDKN